MWTLSDDEGGSIFKCEDKSVDLSEIPVVVEKIEIWGDVVLKVKGVNGYCVVLAKSGMVKIPREYNDLIQLENFADWLENLDK